MQVRSQAQLFADRICSGRTQQRPARPQVARQFAESLVLVLVYRTWTRYPLVYASWFGEIIYARLMREHIVNEIRRIASANGGKPPGRRSFELETGIRTSEWYGVIWARWSDALAEAGFEPNQKQGKLDREFLLEKCAQAFRHYGRVPTAIELRMYSKLDPAFPATPR